MAAQGHFPRSRVNGDRVQRYAISAMDLWNVWSSHMVPAPQISRRLL
jgi:hypothetical protein